MLQSETAENLDVVGLRAKYDRCVKVLLSNKPLLAWILKGCAQTLLANLKNLIKNAGVTADQAMDLLAVAPEERTKYAIMLEEAGQK